MQKSSIPIYSGNTRMVAHRGLSGIERENTKAAFVAAGIRTYYGIETDIHRTSDGQFVVFHDDTTARLTEKDWVPEQHTLAELQSLALKDMDGRFCTELSMPTLGEYIRICKQYNKVSVLELKNHMEQKDIQNIVGIIREEDYLDQTIFISFDLANLLCIRKILPHQTAQYLVGTISEELLDILVAHDLDLDIYYEALTADFAAQAHAAGRKINVWTVDVPADAKRMVRLGVDYITSNILE